MRTLIEEFGHTVIVLVIASVMVTGLIGGIFIPGLQFYTTNVIQADAANTNNSLSENLNRANPVIIAPSVITMNISENQIDFNDYISSGAISVINADGDDISANIVIKAKDEASANLYNESDKVFGGSEIATGEYNFIISVVDYTNEKYFGKVSEMNFTVSVAN